MRRLALVASVLATLAAGAWLLLAQRAPGAAAVARPAEEGEASGRVAAPTLAAPAPLRAAPEPRAAPPLEGERATVPPPESPASPPPADPEGGAVVGRVLRRADGSPVAGARVRARLSFERGASETLDSRSAEDGSYRIDVAGRAELHWVEALATPDTPSTGQVGGRARLSGGRVVAIDLSVGAGGRASGRVLDAEGGGVAAAEVLLWSGGGRPAAGEPPERTTRTAFDGAFAFERVGPEVWIEARREGLVCTLAARAEVADGEHVEDLCVELGKPWPLRGRVVDAGGRGVEGARIMLSADLYRAPGFHQACRLGALRSDGEGAFAFDAMPPSVRWHLTVDHPRFLHARRDLEEVLAAPITIRLESGRCRTIRVVDRAGEPLAGAYVRLWIPREKHVEGRTEADGRFEACGLPEAPDAILGVHAPGHAMFVQQPLSLDPGAPDPEVRLEPGLDLAGRVVDVEERAVADASVHLVGERHVTIPNTTFGEPTTWEWLLRRHRTSTDANGRFAFEDLPPGTFALRVAEPGAPEASWVVEARAGERDVVVRLAPHLRTGVTLRGTVVDDVTGEPVPAFRVVSMEEREFGWDGTSHSCKDGAYLLSGLEEGRKILAFEAVGYAALRFPPRDFASGEHRVDARLLPERDVVLRIVDARGEPLARRTFVRFRDLEGQELWHRDPVIPGDTRNYAESEDDGRVAAYGLPATVVRVVVELDDGELVRELDLRDPPAGPIEWRLGRVLGE